MGRRRIKILCFHNLHIVSCHLHRVPCNRCWDGMEDIIFSVSAPISVSLVAPDYGGPGATTLSEPMHRSISFPLTKALYPRF